MKNLHTNIFSSNGIIAELIMTNQIIVGVFIAVIGGFFVFLLKKIWDYLGKIAELEKEIQTIKAKLEILQQMQPNISEILKTILKAKKDG
ncbi:hypothetical protein CGC54_10160 [Capnocytophaga canimorsus]|uniref:Uncharacterized protein n=1 Tax=Capnocytophaga canimorsus TaxID=28188 RepID=A0AAC9Z5D5_9FLAO|nr:hypothetical protein [Capnocytophaga canimorsus]ATA94668.1 hypothetical protein CGC54_10160 [Capnocytophaga canimorsus]